MIPLTLSITGFGPYREEQIIDFTSMGEAPLFLINGPTGAGKTTILDAICYALYGRATWKSRQIKDMRCHHCARDDKTIVSFDFAARGETFRVVREPEYVRRALNGGENSEARNQNQAKIYKVTYLNGEEVLEPLVRRKGQVTDKVVEILGLDAEQFCQVIVLPQGVTRELLNESSIDRERVYEKLFNTGIFVRIEDVLRDRKREIDRQTHDLTREKAALLAKASVTTQGELTTTVENLEEEREELVAKLRCLNDELDVTREAKSRFENENRAFAEIAEARTRLAELEGEQAQIDRLIAALEQHNHAEPLEPLFEIYTRTNAAVLRAETEEREALLRAQQLEGELEAARVADQVSRDNATERDGLLRQRTSLESILASISELAAARVQLEAAIRNATEAQIAIDNAETNVTTLAEDVHADEQDIARRRQQVEDTPNFDARQLQLEEIDRVQNEAVTASARVSNAERVTEEAWNAHAESVGAFEEDNAAFLALQRGWHLGQAAALAEQLEEGVPCSVCGSQDHPAPATNEEEHVSSDDLEIARVSVANSLAAVRTAELNVSNAQTSLEREITDLEAARVEIDRVNPDGVNITEALAQIENQRGAAENARIELQLAIEAHDLKVTELKCAIATRNIIQNQKFEADGAVIGHRRTVGGLSGNLPTGVGSAEELQTQIEGLNGQIALLDTASQEAIAALTNAERNYAAANATAEGAARNLRTARIESTDAVQIWQTAFDDSVFQTKDDWQLALMSPEVERGARNDVSEHSRAIAVTEGAIEAHQRTVEGIDEVHNMEPLEEKLSELEDAVTDVDTERNTVNLNHANMARLLSELVTIQNTLDELTAEFGPIDELYRLASGRASGHISLHRHIQGKILDEVVVRGNNHYRRMTNGRYSLKRRTVASSGGGHDGLALNIYDAQSATERSVSTLSGGESFQAQTALALGLSETVQAHAGGVQLETLFIDEGFGSLDADSLQLAIETLMEIQASGRYVGVISHVDSMNAQIDTQIRVTSSKRGSKIEVVV